jgi:hypothetical protein
VRAKDRLLITDTSDPRSGSREVSWVQPLKATAPIRRSPGRTGKEDAEDAEDADGPPPSRAEN